MPRAPFTPDKVEFYICSCCGNLKIAFYDANGVERASFGANSVLIFEAVKLAIAKPERTITIAYTAPSDTAFPVDHGVPN